MQSPNQVLIMQTVALKQWSGGKHCCQPCMDIGFGNLQTYLFVWVTGFGIRSVTKARQYNGMSLLLILSSRSNVLTNQQGMRAEVYVEVEHIGVS